MFMYSLLAIPIVEQATQSSTSPIAAYFSQPIDAILFDMLIWVGWIPIVVTFAWGMSEVWLNSRYGKYGARLKHVLLAIDVPPATEQTPKALENLFATIYGAKSSITWKEKWIYGKYHPTFSFEIISTEGYVQFLIRTQTRFRDTIEAGIYAHYPEAEIYEVEDYTENFPSEYPDDEMDMWGGEVTFDKPSHYPIRTYVDFEDRLTGEIKDPLGYTLEQMAKMRPGEHFWIQLLVRPSGNSWIDDGIKHVKKLYGKEEKKKEGPLGSITKAILSWPTEFIEHTTGTDLSGVLFSDSSAPEEDPWKAFKITPIDKEEADAVLRKTTKVGHGAKIRILYLAKKNAFVKSQRTVMVKGMLNQYAHLNFNRFTLYGPQVPKDDYFWMQWSYTKRQRTLMRAYKGRSWGIGANNMWMNAEELASLWHFPTIAVKAPLVKKAVAKRAEPPSGLSITNMENVLPNFVPPGADVADNAGGPPASLPGAVATSDNTTGEPPIGLPMDLPIKPPVEISEPTIHESPPAQQVDLMAEPPVLPNVTAPTETAGSREEASQNNQGSSDGGNVPPNLPV